MFSPDDTIVAPATPPGRGGLAVVRLSGPRSAEIASALVEGVRPLVARVATLVRVRGKSPATNDVGVIDEAIATFFPAGSSYTGEDVVELSVHGSPVVVGEVVAAAVAAGARPAGHGEFTLRAFLHGRLDLTRAEAVQDLVESTTPAQAAMAFDQLSGTLAERIGEIERQLFDLSARLEASGDFPEEGYHFISPEEVRTAIEEALQRVERLLADGRRGRLIREGVSVAIVGRPNVGKSTLFNRLAGAERAIVTEVPGTTRDVLTESVMLLGTRMLLADTAGVRESLDPIEREGVARAKKAGDASDVVVVVLDGSEPLEEEDRAVLQATADRPRVVAINKSDVAARRGEPPWPEGVRISAMTGAGVDGLVAAIADQAGLELTGAAPQTHSPVSRQPPRLGQTPAALTRTDRRPEHVAVTNIRHIELLGQTAESLRRALALLADVLGQIPEEILLSDLREARERLEDVSGKRTTDELLDAIFSRFCIGK